MASDDSGVRERSAYAADLVGDVNVVIVLFDSRFQLKEVGPDGSAERIQVPEVWLFS